MKKYLVLLGFTCVATACSKSNSTPDTQTPSSQIPIAGKSWVFTVNASDTRYTYIRSNLNNMFRKDVDKTYSLYDLSNDDNCEFYVSETLAQGAQQAVTIQLAKNKNRWCFVAPSSNKQEMHMGMSYSNSITVAPGDEYKFFLHRQPAVNGIITAVFESVAHPGYYMSASQPGFNYAANQMTFTKEISPEKATGWQCRMANQ